MRDDYKAQASITTQRDPGAEQTALACAYMTFDEARHLVNRIETLADRLCGCQPEKAESVGIAPSPNGVLPGLADEAQSVARRLNKANCELDRIERAL